MREGFVSIIIITASAIFGWFVATGWKADDAFSEEARTALSRRLAHLRVDQFQENRPTICFVFDCIFGERHFSVKCVARSFVASVLCATLGCVLMLAMIETGAVFRLLVDLVRFVSTSEALLITCTVYVIFFYIALLKIRHVLYWMIGRPSRTTKAVGAFFVYGLSFDLNLLLGHAVWPFFDYATVWPRAIALLIFNFILDCFMLVFFLVAVGIYGVDASGDIVVLRAADEAMLVALFMMDVVAAFSYAVVVYF